MDGFGFTGTMEKLGVERRLLTAGENKGFLDPFSPQTEKQRAFAQTMLDQIHMQFTVTGKGIPAAAVERAIAMSHEKYCSASIMLGKTAAITTGFTLIEA